MRKPCSQQGSNDHQALFKEDELFHNINFSGWSGIARIDRTLIKPTDLQLISQAIIKSASPNNATEPKANNPNLSWVCSRFSSSLIRVV